MPRATLIRARPRQARPPQLQSTQGEYGSALFNIVNGAYVGSVRQPVNSRTVAGLTGAWAAVLKIANAVGQMMSAAEAFGPDGRTPLDPPGVLTDPCTGYEPFVYWREATSTALMRGNWIGLKCDPDPISGYARQVLPLPVDAVNAHYDEDGFPVYEIGGDEYGPEDIVHVKVGLTFPGQIMAMGVVEAHRQGLGGMLDLQGMTAGVWRQGAVPSGVVQVNVDSPTQDQVNDVKAGWVNTLGGQRTVAVTGKNMTYTPITWSAQDAQWLESRTFTIAECALMFGLRPEDLGSSFGAKGALTYGNRTDDALQRIIDSYVPVMLPFEQAWSRLITGRNFVRGNAEALLRATTKERYELHLLAQQAGIETQDETREIEGKPPLPKAEEPPAPPTPPTDQTTTQEVSTNG